MTVGLLKGANKSGHRGWTTEKCIICNTTIDFFHGYDQKSVYYCPKCIEQGLKAYFCAADSRKLHYKCPFCKGELKPYY